MELCESLRNTEKGRRVVLLGDMKRRAGKNEVEWVLAKWGMDRMNENSEHHVEVCGARGQFLIYFFSTDSFTYIHGGRMTGLSRRV